MGKMGECGQKYKSPATKNERDGIHSMGTIIILFYIFERQILKILIRKKKNFKLYCDKY